MNLCDYGKDLVLKISVCPLQLYLSCLSLEHIKSVIFWNAYKMDSLHILQRGIKTPRQLSICGKVSCVCHVPDNS